MFQLVNFALSFKSSHQRSVKCRYSCTPIKRYLQNQASSQIQATDCNWITPGVNDTAANSPVHILGICLSSLGKFLELSKAYSFLIFEEYCQLAIQRELLSVHFAKREEESVSPCLHQYYVFSNIFIFNLKR